MLIENLLFNKKIKHDDNSNYKKNRSKKIKKLNIQKNNY